MKIALVIQNAEPARGGAERYTVNLAADLVARGHEVHLLAQRFARNVEPAQQVRLAGAAGTRVKRYQTLLDSLADHLRQNRYDIVHAMLPVPLCDVYQPHAGIEAENLASGHLKHGSPVGRLLARVGNQFSRKRRLIARVEWQMVTGLRPPLILCLSDYVRQAALKHYPAAAGQMAVLHNGVSLDRFDPAARPGAGAALRQRLNLSSDTVMALIIAQDFRRKGLRTALAALAQLDAAHRARTALVVVGRENPTPYRRLAQEAGIADRVIFAGLADDPYAMYQAADLFILPTSHDPCSLVVLESLAMGVPVLTSSRNGAGELMTPGRHGQVIADPSDAAAFAAAWAGLLDQPALTAAKRACLDLRPRLAQQLHVSSLLEHYAARIAAAGSGSVWGAG